jgi:hypothetical protein
MCQLLWWFVFWRLNSFLTACVLLMFFHAVSYTFFFSNSTFADGHCKGHNLLLSWRAYMNCVQRRRKHAKKQEGHLLRTHPHSTEFSEVLARTHPHSHNSEASKSTPHLRRTHIFSSISWMSHSSARMWKLMRFLRTHPHWSARIVHLCIRAGC